MPCAKPRAQLCKGLDMAKRKPQLTPEIGASDLQITITPRACVTWAGSIEQLRAEGLIPPGIELPKLDQPQTWNAGGHKFSLHRSRPEWEKGRAWCTGNFWCLHRLEKGVRDHVSWDDAAVYQKQKELEHEIWRRSPEGLQMIRRWAHAATDRSFQAFLKAAILPDQRKPETADS
ncbi:hypothetical protein WDL1CHR_04870 [Variovorax sp. WDL1]|nr:hypothetical protein CHC06_06897 [Variovorax sp. B2]VTV14319.1 hypothetical protein WDL1CHR_04870 [Variovorax sp. WDL1]